jgi:hypothetical protein
VRWEATLLGGGWRGSPDDDLLPAAGLLIDAGFEGPSRSKGRGASSSTTGARPRAGRRDLRLVADLVARVERATARLPTGGASARPSSRPTP